MITFGGTETQIRGNWYAAFDLNTSVRLPSVLQLRFIFRDGRTKKTTKAVQTKTKNVDYTILLLCLLSNFEDQFYDLSSLILSEFCFD